LIFIQKIEKETPYSECNNKTNYYILSKYIGKLCDISLKTCIQIPDYQKGYIQFIKATIQEYDKNFVSVKFINTKNNKNYLIALRIDNINAIIA